MFGRFMRAAGLFEQRHELGQLLGRQMAELLVVTSSDAVRQLIEQFDPDGCDRNLHDASVFGPSLAFDEFPLFEPIEQPGHIGRAGNEPRSERERRNRPRLRSAEQSQRVVLLGREIVLLEQPFLDRLEAVIGAPQEKIGLLFRRVETLAVGWRGGGGLIHAIERTDGKTFQLG